MSEDATLDEFVEAESNSSESAAEDLARKTVCGIPPEDWTVARLGELVRVVSGSSLPTEYQNDTEAEHPVYKVSDMNASGNQKYVSEASNWLSEEELEELNHTLYPKGTTILPKVGAALLTNKRRVLTQPSSFDNNVMGWVPDEINPEFLYYVSCTIDMEAVAQKGAVPSISKAIAKSLKLPSPPLSEQRKIATVLYTVDRAIEKTEKIISQVQSVLSGVTDELLIKGYGEKKLEQNRIYSFEFQMPTDWEVVELQTLNKDSKPICYGIVQPGEYYEDGIPILNIEHSRYGDEIDVDELHRVSTELHEKYSRSKLTGGEVVISVKGSTGDVGRVPSNIDEWNISRDLARISPKDGINRDWLRFYLSTELAQKFIHVNSPGSTRDSLNIGDLKQLPILLPPQDEQDQIADVVAQIEHKLDSESQYLHQLRRLKHGLMQDLLSGTVRTNDTNIEVPEEIAQYG